MKNKIFLKSIILLVMALLVFAIPVLGQATSDWPMWRFDANRSASSPAGLPNQLYLQWEHQYAPRVMVWDDPLNQDLMPYDRVFEPIVVGNTMFLGFNDTDKIIALDTNTGEEKWSFYAGGPVRLPGVVWNDKIYFGSDDGYMYCLHTSNGKLAWKFQAAPKDCKILGNLRLISTWPVRGGPVIEDGVVYFAASVFPMMGTFIYALDAETGEVIWLNDGEGSRWSLMPHHGSEAFAGVAPQGSLVISGNSLIIPSGRAVPASFNKNTGEYQYYRIQEFQKTGGSFAAATDNLFFNHYRENLVSIYDTNTGLGLLGQIGRFPVIDGSTIYTSKGGTVSAHDISGIEALAKKGPPEVTEELKEESLAPGYTPFYIGYMPETVDEKGFQNQALAIWEKSQLWTISADASGDLIKAGNCLYAADGNSITAINVGKVEPSIDWVMRVDAPVGRLLSANGKLFAVTLDGSILAFGGEKVKPNLILNRPIASGANLAATKEALSIIEKSGVSEGYALFYGISDGALLEALVNNSNLDIIAVDPDKAKVEEMHRHFDTLGTYGKRISVFQGTPLTLNAPQYMASLTIVNQGKLDSKMLSTLYFSMRPYGGKVLFRTEPANLRSLVANANLSKLKVVGDNLISREGALEGSDSFTHVVGDVANTGVVNDNLVKLPLGILWWGGGASNLNVLPRHAHGPTPQVIGGRLYIEGIDRITCRDVYTGRQIWQDRFDDMETYGIYYSESYKDDPLSTRYNQEHLPGIKARGTNYIATEDIVYVVNAYPETNDGWKVDMVDAATGKLLGHIDLPKIPYRAYDKERELNQQWGYIGVFGDLLIGGGEWVAFSDLTGLTKAEVGHEYYWEDWDYGASKRLFIMDRHTGEIKWSIESKFGFINVAVAAGGGMLFVLDKLPPAVEIQLERKGKDIPTGYRLIALDINTGKVVWEDTKNVFGSYLVYSEEYDILLQSTHPSKDSMIGENGNRMVACRASTGEVLWDAQKGEDEEFLYFQFPLVHHDTIISGAKQEKAEGRHFSLLTGERLTRKSPITESDVELRWARRYGCNFALGAEHLLTFRSGCAAYFDLNQDSGTGSFGGFKSGCTNSLIVADGVLNSPDYTRTCTCCYPNQTSLALVYMPENEMWTFNELDLDEAPVKTIGLNLGAHGDRVADSGMWWFDYPIVGGPSPKIPVKTSPAEPKCFRHHSIRFEGELPWIASSGCEGLNELTLGQTEGSYTVRLYFAEPNDYVPGQRVFDVALQDKTVLSKLDVVAAAGKARKTVIKEFKNIWANDKGELVVTFKPLTSAGPIISGIEFVAETTVSAAK
jgi:outer membrane protein assembly factor BamB